MLLFSAEWCTGCKPIKKFLDENERDVEVIDIDTDLGEKLMEEHGVRGLPTYIKEDSTAIVGTEAILKELK